MTGIGYALVDKEGERKKKVHASQADNRLPNNPIRANKHAVPLAVALAVALAVL